MELQSDIDRRIHSRLWKPPSLPLFDSVTQFSLPLLLCRLVSAICTKHTFVPDDQFVNPLRMPRSTHNATRGHVE